MIYDESSDDDSITPIYADEGYREEHGIVYEDYVEEPIEEDSPVDANVADDLGYITPDSAIDVESLPRPTSIASTNPIASKKDASANLSRPHKKSSMTQMCKRKLLQYLFLKLQELLMIQLQLTLTIRNPFLFQNY